MARVVLSHELAQQYANGQANVDVDASDFRSLVKALDAKFPGLGLSLIHI